MRNTKNLFAVGAFVLLLTLALFAAGVSAQTSSFTYQGKLADSGVAANGTYDIRFKLYDTLANGTQIGTDIVRDNVVVSDGGFTVDLDFGVAAFASGASRFLQLEVRPGASTGTFTPLVPRQPLTSSPYAVKAASASTADALSASCVSCVTDANIDTVNAGKVTGVLGASQGGTGIGPAPPPAGTFLRSNGTGWEVNGILASDIPTSLGSYIQNTTTTQTANFSVNGTGTASIFNATAQYNIGGSRVLSIAGTSNLFAGTITGPANTGDANSFVGSESGSFNTTGRANTFVGFVAGRLNTLGNNNTFMGSAAGDTNTTGSRNTIIGSLADVATNNLNYATAIGAEAVVSSSNTVVLGRSLDTVQIPGTLNAATLLGTPTANIFNATTQYNIGGNRVLSVTPNSIFAGINAGAVNTGGNNSFFGIEAGKANTSANNNSFFGRAAGLVNNIGDLNAFFGSFAGSANTMGSANSFFGTLAGNLNTLGGSNSFFGFAAGENNNGGSGNSFFGIRAGDSNTVGGTNTIIGADADVGANNLTNATAIGANTVVSQSNSLVLGNNANVGIGTSSPNAKLQIAGGNVFIANPGGNLIMTSPNGACWALSVSNTGVLSTTSVTCP